MSIVTTFIAQYDANAILTPAQKARRRIIFKFFGAVRTTAKHSIKLAESKLQRSLPGYPPLSHKPNQAYKNLIFFAIEADGSEGVAGGIPFADSKGTGKVPKIIEYGGEEDVLVGHGTNRRRKRINYKARPAMRLAYAKTVEKTLPKLIENSIVP